MQPLSPVLEKSIVNACIEQPLQKSQESTEQPAPFVEEAVKRATTKGKAGRKRTVKRSTISASSSAAAALDPAATLPPIVKKMNAPIALKSSKEPGTRLKSFGVSERAINQLKIIWSHSSVTGEFGVFENVIFHLYTSLAKLQKHLEAELKIDTLTSSLKALVPQFHFNLYEVLINVHLKLLHEDDEIQEIGKERLIFQDIPLVIDALVESIGKIDNTFSQRETKSTLIQRLGNLRQRERLAGNILTPIRSTLDELNITLPVLRELSSLPPASLHALSLPLSYMFQDFPELKEEPLNESQNRLTAYADCMATLIEQAAKRGFSGVISMPNSLYRLFLTDAAALSGISFKDESKAFTLLGDAELAINEMEQLQKQTSLLYCKAASGLLTYRQFVEECHVAVVKEKTQKEFTAMLLNGFLTWSVMIDNLAFIYNCSATLISKNNPLLIEEEMLAKIACCWHEVSAQRDNKNHQLLAGTAHVAKEQIAANISHELLIDLIDGYLKDVIAVYKQFGTILTKEIMDDLESFLDREHPMQWQKLHHLRKVLHPLQAIVHDFRSKSFLFNKNMRLEYEKLLHQHEISFQEASFLRGILMQLKCDISDIISPPLELLELFLKATDWNQPQRNSKGNAKGSLKLSFGKAEIPWIFDIKLTLPPENRQDHKPHMETTPHERAAAATPNLHPKSCPETEDSAQLTLAPVKPVLSQSSLKSVPSEAEHQESHTDSFKLKVLLKFLTDKGWEVSSIKGSHLKLKLRGEALIIPVNNPELKRGTLHGILKQEKEKEKRLIEKK